MESLVFLVGDAGAAVSGTSPVLAHLSRAIDRWGADLPDSAVSVLFLGDNVYPVGIRDRDDSEFSTDSTRLWSQVELLATPTARERGVRGIFTPGNHDWGNAVGEAGRARLANQEAMLGDAHDRGILVSMAPTSGLPGPHTIDVPRFRLVAIDTHWFLQERPDLWEDIFFESVSDALSGRDGREVVMFAHHPFRSGGPHGALVPAMEASGLLYLFKKTGTLIQDLNSPHFSSFLNRLRRAFDEGGGPPLVFAGGHDHSLQVLNGLQENDPSHVLVSGAGSKSTEVTAVPEIRLGVPRPGYMQLFGLRDGGVELRVVAGREAALDCASETEPEELDRCMSEELAAFEDIYAERLSPPGRE